MNKKSESMEIKPEIIKWAIDTAGFENKEISKRLSKNDNIVDNWLSGKTLPTLRQLEKLAYFVKRPFASLFLPKVPDEKPLPKDFRVIQNREGKFKRKTIFAIRKARSLQKLSKELSIYTNEEIKTNIKKLGILEDPKKVASSYRKLFGLDENKQTKKFKNHYELYNYLRSVFEKLNIFVFQISMPLDDARGFVLTDDNPFVIVVNSADIIDARIFTLMHEFGHIILGEMGIDIPDFGSSNKVENWCNKFSSAFLLPEDIAKRIFEENKRHLTANENLNYLSNKYKVSKTMLLYNMLQLKYIHENVFNSIMEKYRSVVAKKTSGSPPFIQKIFSEMGPKFVLLVADNLDKKNITYSDALGYLSVKSSKLNGLLNKVRI